MNNQRSPLIFIFLSVFIDLLGIGIVLPLLPFYVKLIEETGSGWMVANYALIVGALTASYAFFQFLFAPILGALSDRYGRRPILLLSLVGAGFSYILFGLADQFAAFGATTVLAVLFGSRIFAGITGGSISTAQAYIADVTTPETRAKGMGMLGAAFGLGFMLGPAIGGMLSTISLGAPAFVAATLAFGNAIFGYFKLPESLPVERRSQQISSLNPFRRLGSVVGRSNIRPLLLGIMMLNLAFAGLQSNFAVFTSTRFAYGPSDIAFLFAFIGLIAVVMQGGLIRHLVPRFGEARLALTGLSLMVIAFTLIAVIPSAWMLYPAVGILVMGSSMATPSLTSLISRSVGPSEQGSVLGGTQALNSLTMVVGPITAGLLFDTIGQNAPYIAGAVLIASALAVLFAALRPQPRPQSQPTQPLNLRSHTQFEASGD
ncbi:MFS transporter [Candidatus Viridilinea mediisalina]|uniref:Tetracycline resistance MFS efflux pump n=1 Tax=Candidatus Viridilinea mediisalina TaxID=2024553 RepID=A0A2A6RIC0_9CHLR|nr:MFS transporter [Candidatus Viridilinea mediisalina]PDW02590.1 tetracycline resistance MFS efflux pump [Candidatus Viridilinea mediisalina]